MGEVSAATMRELIFNGAPVKVLNPINREFEFRPLIEPVKDVDGEFIEGSAFDFRAHVVYRGVAKNGFMPYMGENTDEDLREFTEVQEIQPQFDEEKKTMVWILRPNKRYLVESLETVNTPWYMRCIPRQKSSVLRMFCNLIYSSAHPGYCGPIIGLLDIGEFGMRLKVDSKVAYVTFSTFESDTVVDDIDLYDKRANWGTGKNIVIPESGRIER